MLEAMRAVLVTGVGGAIGAACCRMLFTKYSSQVVIGVDARLKDQKRKESLEGYLNVDGVKKRFFAVSDVSDFLDEDGVVKALQPVLDSELGENGLDAVISVAGGNPPGTSNVSYPSAGLTPTELYESQFQFNFLSSATIVRTCMPKITAGGGGSIVLTSSVNGTLGIGETAYAVSKVGLHALARNIASAHGGDGVTANAVALGTVYSENIWGPALEEDPGLLSKIGARNPRNKVGTPEEAASILCFLASPESDLINGQVITADGGWGMVAGTINHDAGADKRWFD